MTSELKPYKEAAALLTLKEKIAQSFMPAVYINDSEEDIRRMEDLIRSHHIGGICFFHSRASAATNFEGAKEVIYNAESLDVMKGLIKRYQKAAKYPLLISIDAEWGLAMRIENTPQYPYAICLGAMKDREDLVFQVAEKIGADCHKAGIHWNFAPVADVNNNPDNPVIGYRSFGEDPQLVARYATAFTRGLQNAGILTSAKHFPGHGDTATDSHLGLPVIDKPKEQLYANELTPFLKLIKEGVDSVMVGHLAVPALCEGRSEPSSASGSVINNFLRKELGFKGVVVSDALNMYAVSKHFDKKGELEWQAYEAGTDILCYAENVVEGIQLISEKTKEDEVEVHFKRVWQLKEQALKNATNPPVKPKSGQNELLEKLARNSLCMVRGSEQELNNFKAEKFGSVVVSPHDESIFMDRISQEFGTEILGSAAFSTDEIQEAINPLRHVLLALYPPSIKPINNFGIPDREIEMIREIAKNKTVILYLFGNPYVLKLFNLDHFEGINVIFQDFEEFQINAFQNFLGNSVVKGELAVTINKR